MFCSLLVFTVLKVNTPKSMLLEYNFPNLLSIQHESCSRLFENFASNVNKSNIECKQLRNTHVKIKLKYRASF